MYNILQYLCSSILQYNEFCTEYRNACQYLVLATSLWFNECNPLHSTVSYRMSSKSCAILANTTSSHLCWTCPSRSGSFRGSAAHRAAEDGCRTIATKIPNFPKDFWFPPHHYHPPVSKVRAGLIILYVSLLHNMHSSSCSAERVN